MKLAYYGNQISPNIVRTPEGYLICQNVPIGRTGDQQYLARELGLEGIDPETIITVHRDEAQVFDKATLASFEGKPVTDGHPHEDVEPHNYANYQRGHVQNVRRGVGKDDCYIMADLYVTDPNLISAVENAVRREVSCGYSCGYTDNGDGTFSQVGIRGNHVAVVDEGRAGKAVSIKDAKPEGKTSESTTIERRKPLMSKKQTNLSGILNLFARSVRDAKSLDEVDAMTKDASDAIASCMGDMSDAVPPAAEKKEEPKPSEDAGITLDLGEGEKPEAGKAEGALLAAVEKLTDAIEKLTAGKPEEKKEEKVEKSEEEIIDELISELEGKKAEDAADAVEVKEGEEEVSEEETEDAADVDPAENEASVTVPAENMDEAPAEDACSTDAKDAVMKSILKDMKPVIAGIKDAADRKAVVDALYQSVRSQKDSMAAVMAAQQGVAKRNAADSAMKQADPAAFNLEAQQAKYDALNPHLKKNS